MHETASEAAAVFDRLGQNDKHRVAARDRTTMRSTLQGLEPGARNLVIQMCERFVESRRARKRRR